MGINKHSYLFDMGQVQTVRISSPALYYTLQNIHNIEDRCIGQCKCGHFRWVLISQNGN